MIKLNEDSRSQLISRAKKGDPYKDQSKGKNRYERRLHSKIAPSVRQYNEIDMNKFFKDNILNVNIQVKGETNDYLVRMSFGGILDGIKEQIERQDGNFNLRCVMRALTAAFNNNDVYIHCSCPDWNFRFSYWSRVNDISSDKDNEQTNNGKEIRNPNDTKGPGCKHVLLLLSNNSWLVKIASVIFNYINYIKAHQEKLYADIIYPAIYGTEYEEPVQLGIEDTDELSTGKDDIDISNKYARTKSQFKAGNQSGVQFAPPNKEDEKQINFDQLMSDTTT